MAETVTSKPAPHTNPSMEVSNLSFALAVSIPVLIFLLVVVAYPLAYAFYLSSAAIRRSGPGLPTEQGCHRRPYTGLTAAQIGEEDTVGLGLALILKHLPGRWRWLRALIILPWAVSPYGVFIARTVMMQVKTKIMNRSTTSSPRPKVVQAPLRRC